MLWCKILTELIKKLFFSIVAFLQIYFKSNFLFSKFTFIKTSPHEINHI